MAFLNNFQHDVLSVMHMQTMKPGTGIARLVKLLEYTLKQRLDARQALYHKKDGVFYTDPIFQPLCALRCICRCHANA